MKIKSLVANAKEFESTTLKCLQGKVPTDIKGSYYRNGASIFNIGQQIIEHWFAGLGGILRLKFAEGSCEGQFKMCETANYERVKSSNSFQSSLFQKIWARYKYGPENSNPANTSVLCLKDSANFLALCEAGAPFAMQKSNLKSIGFDNFGWIKSAFSAHPKVDPQNGDIYNIGMSIPNFTIMRSTKDMRKISETQFKLREIQSIHDFCLAGDYLIVFENSIRFRKGGLLTGEYFINCCTPDKQLPTKVHIYKKKTLQLVKVLDFNPFYSFHFTNGYSTEKQIVVEYVKYDIDSATELFKFIKNVPKLTQQGFEQSYRFDSYLEELKINLKDFSFQVKNVQINGEFPVCEDHEVGKQWRYTYGINSHNKQEKGYVVNSLFKFDREEGKLTEKYLGEAHLNEPTIIRTKESAYLLCVVNRNQRSYVQIFNSSNFDSICQLQLPEFVPIGFHGKWDASVL